MTALIRLTPSGRLDPRFGDGGKRCDSRIDEIVIQPDHRILAVGDALEPHQRCGGFAMARYLAR